MSAGKEGWDNWAENKKYNRRIRSLIKDGKPIYLQLDEENGPIFNNRNQQVTKEEAARLLRIPRLFSSALPAVAAQSQAPQNVLSRDGDRAKRHGPSHGGTSSQNPVTFASYSNPGSTSSNVGPTTTRKSENYVLKSDLVQASGRSSDPQISATDPKNLSNYSNNKSRHFDDRKVSRVDYNDENTQKPSAALFDRNSAAAEAAAWDKRPDGTHTMQVINGEMQYLDVNFRVIERPPLGSNTIPAPSTQQVNFTNPTSVLSTNRFNPERDLSGRTSIAAGSESRHQASPRSSTYQKGGESTLPRPARRSSNAYQSMDTIPENLPIRSTRIRTDGKGKREKLDERYCERDKSFYCQGRVFAMLWHESNTNPKTSTGTSLSDYDGPCEENTGKFGETVYTTIRRMIVVNQQHAHAVCVPIITYRRQGCTKPGLTRGDVAKHAVAHMNGTEPITYKEELRRGMNKQPVAIKPASASQKLDQTSRINFGKPYSIEYNIKTMDVGLVPRASIPYLIGAFVESTLPSNPQHQSASKPSGSSNYQDTLKRK